MATREAVIYTRVSSGKQAEDGISLDAQFERAAVYAKEHGLHIRGVFREEGKSGGSVKNRDELKAALEALKPGDVFIVYSLSRLARNLREFLAIRDDIKDKYKAELVSLSENIDDSSSGQLVMHILAVVAEWERSVDGDRVKAVKEYKREKGEFMGGKIPFGYKLGDDGKKLVEIEREQKVIRRIVNLRNKEKLSYAKIAKKLDDDGVPHSENSKKWWPEAVRNLYTKHKDRNFDV